MKRDEAERIFSHHYRLYSQVRAVVDTSPPKSMYNSPKSIHYRPSGVVRRTQSVESLNRRQYQGGRVELAQFLQRPATTTVNQKATRSFNVYSSGSMSNLSVFNPPKPPPLDLSKIGSKVRYNRNYQPPKRKQRPNLPRPNSKSSSCQSYSSSFQTSTSERTPKTQAELIKPNNYYGAFHEDERLPDEEEEIDEYEEFKNTVLDDILVRGVYSDRVIKDAFAHEMEKRRGILNMKKMKKIMLECFDDLGVEMDNDAEFRRRAILAHSDLYPYESSNYNAPQIERDERETFSRRKSIREQIMQGSTGSSGSTSQSSASSSHRSSESHFSYERSDDRRSPPEFLESDGEFALDAKPPSNLSSSSSELTDFPRESAHHFVLPDRELSLSSQDDEFPDLEDAQSDLSQMIERARSIDRSE
ncbi:hypothetical protein QR680_006114 [Steinernema hermaphroditum]|uniref:Uncharacterized protein n=1 Tax=Steinernema hermaphroditum TaxID=289476 RepID=A0AA39HUE8_9BILA|nr:hypothetical protein QR680_006114 [Steinernema hermaphroditum]